MDFYGALFGSTFDVGPEEYGHYTTCLLDGRKAAALTPTPTRRPPLLVERLPGHGRHPTPRSRGRVAAGGG